MRESWIHWRLPSLLCIAWVYLASNTAYWSGAVTPTKHTRIAAYEPAIFTENAVFHGARDASADGDFPKLGRRAWIKKQENDARNQDEADNQDTDRDEVGDDGEDEEEDGDERDDDDDDEGAEAEDAIDTGVGKDNAALQSKGDQSQRSEEGDGDNAANNNSMGVMAPPELSFRGYQRLLADAQERLEKNLFEEVFQEAKVWECLAPMICNLFGKTYYYNPYKRRCLRQSLMARLSRKKKPVFLELSLSCETSDTFDVYIQKVEAAKSPLVE